VGAGRKAEELPGWDPQGKAGQGAGSVGIVPDRESPDYFLMLVIFCWRSIVSTREFKRAISRCSFLFDWQKERLMGMLDGDECEGDDGDNGSSRGYVFARDVFPVLDVVLWRTMGVGLDSLPVGDRLSIEQAVREVAC